MSHLGGNVSTVSLILVLLYQCCTSNASLVTMKNTMAFEKLLIGSVDGVVIVGLALYVSNNLSDNISRVRVSENRTLVSRAGLAGPIIASFPCLSQYSSLA